MRINQRRLYNDAACPCDLRNGPWRKWPLGLPCQSGGLTGRLAIEESPRPAEIWQVGVFFPPGSCSEDFWSSHDFLLNFHSNRYESLKIIIDIVLPCCHYGRNPSAPVHRVSLPVAVCHLRVLLLKLGTSWKEAWCFLNSLCLSTFWHGGILCNGVEPNKRLNCFWTSITWSI